ncbi:DNA gyrase inhibitor YacG [Caulobacter sp. DWR2-3-1b2]|uniref:DNA gyrase inhibitor YacG n=1 Tax=unclassified Caulobacter TaxID=2648921 RepID=UPI0019A438D0|nr:DNA gyrase inhibitor YacG [Caulobacter sp.]
MSACPICKKPAIPDFRPFCCKRCADVDLNRWLSDRYVVPGADEDEENPPSTDLATDFGRE